MRVSSTHVCPTNEQNSHEAENARQNGNDRKLKADNHGDCEDHGGRSKKRKCAVGQSESESDTDDEIEIVIGIPDCDACKRHDDHLCRARISRTERMCKETTTHLIPFTQWTCGR